MFKFMKQVFSALLTCSLHIYGLWPYKIFISEQRTILAKPTLIDLNLSELHYHPYMGYLGRCTGSCNTPDDLSSKTCVLNKTEVVNVNVFNMITRINESRTLTKHILCKCKCKFFGRKCNSNLKWHNNKHWFRKRLCVES